MTARAPDVDGQAAPPWLVARDEHGPSRLAVNIAVGAVVPLLAIVDVRHAGLGLVRGAGVVAIAVVMGVALRYRVRWPAGALAVTLVGVVGATFVGHASPPLMFACLVAVFTVAALLPRREAAIGALISAVVLLAVARTDLTGSMTEAKTLIVVVWTALFFALGLAVRAQRAYIWALAERARRADETREQEARTRVVEERVRIARELHDVVAHHIAVISVHAGLARRAIGRDAATVDSSLGHVQDAARTVLDELGAVLRVLRSEDAAGSTTATEPAPGLDRLESLLATLAGVGLVVHLSVTGRPRELDRGCDLAAFRIVQESLTNAAKHGASAPAELSLSYGAAALTVTVVNLVRVDPVPRPMVAVGSSAHAVQFDAVGHGLIGMRERATASGGSLSARPDGRGAFRVVAVIPYRPTIPDRPTEPPAACDRTA